MSDEKDIQIVGTTTDYIVQGLTNDSKSEEFTQEYLKAAFLSSAVEKMFYARRDAGLTQAQVAEKLRTKQTAIARLEADMDGSMSLRRYVEVALACGMIPLDMTLVPISALRDYVIENPDAPRTADLYYAWLAKKSHTLPD